MAYNTEQQIRDICGMGATNPTSAQITRWQTLIDALITAYNDTPDENVAAIIEANRISEIYRNTLRRNNVEDGNMMAIKPLTPEEKDMLLKEDVQVDAIPINGKRWSDVY